MSREVQICRDVVAFIMLAFLAKDILGERCSFYCSKFFRKGNFLSRLLFCLNSHLAMKGLIPPRGTFLSCWNVLEKFCVHGIVVSRVLLFPRLLR